MLLRTTVPAPSPIIQPLTSRSKLRVAFAELRGDVLFLSKTCSGLPARSTAVITTASTLFSTNNICAISSALKTEFSSDEIVIAGPEKSQSEEILAAMMFPIKLVKRLIGTSSSRLSLDKAINCLRSSSLSVIPVFSRLSSICAARFTRPLNL